VRIINSVKNGTEFITKTALEDLKSFFNVVVFDILGLASEQEVAGEKDTLFEKVVDLLLNLRIEAKTRKDWDTADKIRKGLNAIGIEVNDTKDGFEWKIV
jgi:cysteinyl-tRNA synthetase